MKLVLSPESQSLSRRLALENPYKMDSSEYRKWREWAFWGQCKYANPPSEHQPPSAHEGWAWGQKFREEWK